MPVTAGITGISPTQRSESMVISDCDHCGMPEERLLTDTWTGKSLCLTCLSEICERLTHSPSEGDNLNELLEDVL
jgi:hypothetical protein